MLQDPFSDPLRWSAKAALIVVSSCAAFALTYTTAEPALADDKGVGLLSNEPTLAPVTDQEYAVIGDFLQDLLSADRDHVALLDKAEKGAAAIEGLIDKSENFRLQLNELGAKMDMAKEKLNTIKMKLKRREEELTLNIRNHARCVEHHDAQMARYPKGSASHDEHKSRARLCKRRHEGALRNLKRIQKTPLDEAPFAEQRASLAAAREELALRMADLESTSQAWAISVDASSYRGLMKGGRERFNQEVFEVNSEIKALGDSIDAEIQRINEVEIMLDTSG